MEHKSDRKESCLIPTTSDDKFVFMLTLTLTLICFAIISALSFLVSDEEIKSLRVWFYIPFVFFSFVSYLSYYAYRGSRTKKP